ncbi:hypothetical protein B0A55_01431 [Friedmanniomyces simplex]|uniref:Uncharacterized protein n=1 Tax=Friedmanniomyces simplex TaxID=329884 RepID=A0A4U0Y496_9PEZI|nr:hypothetical protein B0A55_01431 [Friedmanniomyces simplex]
MLSIQSAQAHARTRTLTPNILPATIHHNGPLKIAKRYWRPQPSSASDKKTSTVYLRGRKLRGRAVKLPVGYQGYLLQKTDRDAALSDTQTRQGALRPTRVEDDEAGADGEPEEDEAEEVKVMEQKAVFDEVVVWGHEVLPEDGDEYVKGIEEWIAFAEAMHGHHHQTTDKERIPSVPVRDGLVKSQTT